MIPASAVSTGYHTNTAQVAQLKVALAAVIGVCISSIVSAIVLPRSAQHQLICNSSYILEALGSHSFQLLADFTEVAPGNTGNSCEEGVC